MDPFEFILQAAKRVRVVWWFVAVGAVLAVIAIVNGWHIPPGALVLGGFGLLIGVVALVVTTELITLPNTNRPGNLSLPAQVLLWTFLIIIIFSGACTCTSFFFNKPIPLQDIVFGARPTPTPAPTPIPTPTPTPTPSLLGGMRTQPRVFQVKVKDKSGPVTGTRITVNDAATAAPCHKEHSDANDYVVSFNLDPSTQRVWVQVQADGYEDFDKTTDVVESPFRVELAAKLVKPMIQVIKAGSSEPIHYAQVTIAELPLAEDSASNLYTANLSQLQLKEPVQVAVSAPSYKPQSRSIPVSLLLAQTQMFALSPTDPAPPHFDPVITPTPSVATHQYILLFRDHFNGGTFWEVKRTDMSHVEVRNDEFKSWCVKFDPDRYTIIRQEEVAGDERFKSVQGPNWWTKPPYNLPELRLGWLHIMDDERWYFVEAVPRQ